MKLLKAALLYSAMDRIYRQELPIKTAMQIYRERQKLREHASAYSEMEIKLVEKYAEKKDGEIIWLDNGQFRLKDGCAGDFGEERRTLQDTEVDVTLEKIDLPDSVVLSPADVEQLCEVINI